MDVGHAKMNEDSTATSAVVVVVEVEEEVA